MTIDERLEILLPKSKHIPHKDSFIYGKFTDQYIGFNECRDQCTTNIKQAVERGDILFPEQEILAMELYSIFDKSCNTWPFESEETRHYYMVRARVLISLLTKGVKA